MNELAEYLQQIGALKSRYLIHAFSEVDRKDFISEYLRWQAYEDVPLPIGHGQTISQPYTVAFMLGLLDPRPGEIVLDIGAGSGWQTALLSHVVGQNGYRGQVYALERIPELCALARKNLAKYPELEKRISFFCVSAVQLPHTLPTSVHKIICAAELRAIPEEWIHKLNTGGVLVCPVRNQIKKLIKHIDGTVQEESYNGFVFVPFIE